MLFGHYDTMDDMRRRNRCSPYASNQHDAYHDYHHYRGGGGGTLAYEENYIHPRVISLAREVHRAYQTSLFREGLPSSPLHDGGFYDNVFIRIRGGSSASWQKHSYKIEFNRGHDLVWSAPEWGVDARRTDEVNLNTTWSDKAFVRQSMGFEVMRDTGVTGSASSVTHACGTM